MNSSGTTRIHCFCDDSTSDKYLLPGPGGGQKKATNAVAKKRRKAGGAAVKKMVVGPAKKSVHGVVKESNLGNF